MGTEQSEWTSPSWVRVWNPALDAFSYPGLLETYKHFKAGGGGGILEGGMGVCYKSSATELPTGETPPALTATVKSPETKSTPKS